MIEFIILALLVIGFAVFAYIFYTKQNKLTETLVKKLNEQVEKSTEMMMAGSLQEWQRIKEGKKPYPNKLKSDPNLLELTEENRIPWDDITGVKIDEGPKKKVKIYH